MEVDHNRVHQLEDPSDPEKTPSLHVDDVA